MYQAQGEHQYKVIQMHDDLINNNVESKYGGEKRE